MKPVIVESPYAESSIMTVEGHEEYARMCMSACLAKGEAPYASHLLYTQPGVLDDNNPLEREVGIHAGFAWKHMPGVVTLFYVDCGWSAGMKLALDYCKHHNLPYEVRSVHESTNS